MKPDSGRSFCSEKSNLDVNNGVFVPFCRSFM